MTRKSKTDAAHPAALLMQLRTLHTYVGMLIAPLTLFMAATGLVQVYNLHEAHAGYAPAPIVERLSRLHKDQSFALRRRAGPPPGQPAQAHRSAAPAPEAHRGKLAVTLLKAVFAAFAVGLIFSTSIGVWMALLQARRRRLCALLLAIGALVPLVLAAMTV